MAGPVPALAEEIPNNKNAAMTTTIAVHSLYKFLIPLSSSNVRDIYNFIKY
jgi:hypothetical protein